MGYLNSIHSMCYSLFHFFTVHSPERSCNFQSSFFIINHLKIFGNFVNSILLKQTADPFALFIKQVVICIYYIIYYYYNIYKPFFDRLHRKLRTVVFEKILNSAKQTETFFIFFLNNTHSLLNIIQFQPNKTSDRAQKGPGSVEFFFKCISTH